MVRHNFCFLTQNNTKSTSENLAVSHLRTMSLSLFNQPTPLAYWDPANLLQVTSDGDDDRVKINCVGRNWRNVRCRWEVLEPQLSKVRPLLREMSTTKPEAVTEETLRRLASLCLCPEWHRSQLCQTVSRWVSVVERAALHNQNLIASLGSSVNGLEDRPAKSKKTPIEACEEATFSIELLVDTMTSMRKLPPTRNACAKVESTAQAKAEHQAVALSNKLDEAERQLADCRTKISALEEEKQHDKTKDHLRACQTKRDQLEKENGALRVNISKLALVQDSLAACRAKKDKLGREKETLTAELDKLEQTRDALTAELDRARVEASTSRDGEQHLAAEFKAANSSLKQYRAELAQERGRNTTLREQVASLELSHAELMESMSACWLHRFWAWVLGNGASKDSASTVMPQETVLQTTKVFL